MAIQNRHISINKKLLLAFDNTKKLKVLYQYAVTVLVTAKVGYISIDNYIKLLSATLNLSEKTT